MCVHTNEILDLEDVVKAISQMSARELDGLQAAIDQRRADVKQTVVAERRTYGGGLLQREHHRNPKTGHVGPGYWYFRFREGSEQRSLYVGKTDSPETVVDEKLGKDR
jgi:hypothetical protein